MGSNERQKRALEQVSSSFKTVLAQENMLAHRVTIARVAGASWQEIADALVTSKSTAIRRYSGAVDELWDQYTVTPDRP